MEIVVWNGLCQILELFGRCRLVWQRFPRSEGCGDWRHADISIAVNVGREIRDAKLDGCDLLAR